MNFRQLFKNTLAICCIVSIVALAALAQEKAKPQAADKPVATPAPEAKAAAPILLSEEQVKALESAQLRLQAAQAAAQAAQSDFNALVMVFFNQQHASLDTHDAALIEVAGLTGQRAGLGFRPKPAKPPDAPKK